jgi:hypothetical protein
MKRSSPQQKCCDEAPDPKHCAELIRGIQAVQAKLAEQIQTLQTLRSTLIAHAVTGRIKV